MGTMSFNPEVVGPLNNAIEVVGSDAVKKLRDNIEYIVEVAKETGVEVLVKLGTELLEATDNFAKACGEMQENCEAYAERIKKVQAAFGGGE